MSFTSARFLLHFGLSRSTREFSCFLSTPTSRKFSITTSAIPIAQKMLVVVGGGAAGVYGAIRAKTIAPWPNVLVKISGGGRCNGTNGHCTDKMILAENYPRGHKKFRGPFFDVHEPVDMISWFTDHGVELKVEEDGRVFPVSNNSSSIIDRLMWEAKGGGVVTRTKKLVKTAPANHGKFLLGIEKNTASSVEYIEPDYLWIASGSSSQVTFPKVKAKLVLENVKRNVQQFTQVGPMLVTHWGLSGPVVFRLSAWGGRDLFSSGYKGIVTMDFIPDLNIEDVKSILSRHKCQFAKQKVSNSYPPEFGLAKRFWKYMLDRQGLFGGDLWASISNNSLISVAYLLKNCDFEVPGKGQFKDEFLKAGGRSASRDLAEYMESKIHPGLFFAGENAWSGGYIAGTTIGTRVHNSHLRVLDLG